MIFHYPQFLLFLLLVPVLLLVWVIRGRRVAGTALLLRILMIGCLVIAAADLTVSDAPSASQRSVVLLVDQSDSLGDTGKYALRSEAARIAAAFAAHQEEFGEGEQPTTLTVLWFGNQIVLPGEWNDPAYAPDPPPDLLDALDASGSDLARALRRARELVIPAGEGETFILSDGLETNGNALAEARIAATAGIPIHVIPAEPALDQLSIVYMEVSESAVYAGEEYRVTVHVRNDTGGPVLAMLRLFENETLVQEQQVSLDPGVQPFSLPLRSANVGIARLHAEVQALPDQAIGDAVALNNRAGATIRVLGPPTILVVEGQPGEGQRLRSTLESVGIASNTMTPQALPSRPQDLYHYHGIVLLDVPAHMMTHEQMLNIEQFVRADGRGLLIVGGPNSFGLGGYEDTPLEDVSPVLMEPQPHHQRPDVALLLILDRSASMTIARDVSKFDMAKEAAILSTESLQEEDSLGVLAFDTRQNWTVPLQRIGTGLSLSQIRDAIARLASGGGTDIYGALEVGIDELSRYSASVRHVVLLSDGRSFTNDMDAYNTLLQGARRQGITVSTIAIGYDADTDLLKQLADWGNGRYYFAQEAHEIPQLTMRESEIAGSDPTIQEEFFAAPTNPHPLLSSFDASNAPVLTGYVAATPKETAEVVLTSPRSDPILATWQYGLGRAIAWTPSIGAPWAPAWTTWGNYDSFWATVIQYMLPDPESAFSSLNVTFVPLAEGPGVQMVVDATTSNGLPIDQADAAARITMPNGREQDVGLRQIAPGRYGKDIVMPVGASSILVQLIENGTQHNMEVGYVQPLLPEYLPEPDPTRGQTLLQQIAAETGGMVMDIGSFALQPGTDYAASGSTTNENGLLASPPAWYDQALALFLRYPWFWLLGAALLLWILDIGVRREWVRRRRVA